MTPTDTLERSNEVSRLYRGAYAVYDAILEVDIFPTQSKHFATAQTVVEHQQEFGRGLWVARKP